MRNLVSLTLIIFFSIFLNACGLIDSTEAFYEKYCEEYPNHQGCQDEGEPSGIFNDQDNNDDVVQVYFHLGNAGDSFSINVNDDGTVDRPTSPLKEGYVFLGWYIEETHGTMFDFDSVVDFDITLYAMFDQTIVFDVSEYITIYKSDNERLNQEWLNEHYRYSDYQDDFLADYFESNIEDIRSTLEGTGNGISYNFLSELSGSEKVLSINGVVPSSQTILDNSYAYLSFMDAISRYRWWEIDDQENVIWEIPEPNVGHLAEGLLAYLTTKEAGEIIEFHQGFYYNLPNSWNPQYQIYDWICGDDYNEEIPVFKIGVAPGSETLSRALIDGYQEVCPNFIPLIEVMETNDIYRRVQGDLSDGDTSTYLHFGFGDRVFDIYDTEPTNALTTQTFSVDAIVFLVNSDNPITNVTASDIYYIFQGEYIRWDDLE